MSLQHLNDVLEIEELTAQTYASEKWTREQFIDSMMNISKSCLVITRESQTCTDVTSEVAGFVVCYNNGPVTYIENMSVKNIYLRNGYGTALIKFAESTSKHGHMVCNVSESFTAMHMLLKKNNYIGSIFYKDEHEYYYTFIKDLNCF